MYEITDQDLAKGRRLKLAAIGAPLLLTLVPAALTILFMVLFGGVPATSVVILFMGLILTTLGFLTGIGLTLFFTHRSSKWTKEMRERIAADGIKAGEIDWFYAEMKPSEKRALKSVEARDLLLGDAYRDTLASRLTATRIIKNSRRELSTAKRRQNSIKQLKSVRAGEFQDQIAADIQKISSIETQAREMLAEAESRLAMIEAAASRSGGMADSELALKRLSARANELPLALQSAQVADEIRLELEQQGLEPSPIEKDAD